MCDEAKKRFLGAPAHGVSGRRAEGLQAPLGLAPGGFRVDNYLPCRA